jgi:uncharacterized protein YqhQ
VILFWRHISLLSWHGNEETTILIPEYATCYHYSHVNHFDLLHYKWSLTLEKNYVTFFKNIWHAELTHLWNIPSITYVITKANMARNKKHINTLHIFTYWLQGVTTKTSQQHIIFLEIQISQVTEMIHSPKIREMLGRLCLAKRADDW